MSAEKRLAQLAIDLPPAPSAVGNYSAWVRHNDLLFLSGIGGGPERSGQVGAGVKVAEAYENARGAAINHLAMIREALGSLDAVLRIVKVLGFIHAVTGFTEHPAVLDGATDLFAELFGERGMPARAAIGVASLPFGIPVEIETVVAVRS